MDRELPAQFADVSRHECSGQWSFQTDPHLVEETLQGFSVGWEIRFFRWIGLYEEPSKWLFQPFLQEAIIHYTLDGSEPSPDHGL